MDQYSSYDYYSGIGSDNYSSAAKDGTGLFMAMRADTPGETALTSNMRLGQAGYSSELWAPCDKNKYCRQLGQPDGPVYSKIDNLDKWTEHPPLTYQNRENGLRARYNELAPGEIHQPWQMLAARRPLELERAELTPTDIPVPIKYIPDRYGSFMGKKEGFESKDAAGLNITKSGIFIRFELIIFFIFFVLVALVIKKVLLKGGDKFGGMKNINDDI